VIRAGSAPHTSSCKPARCFLLAEGDCDLTVLLGTSHARQTCLNEIIQTTPSKRWRLQPQRGSMTSLLTA
jgi:hypothetical protein